MKRRGRPSKGLTEEAVLVRAPRSLLADARADAARSGVALSEWIRRAIAQRLVAQKQVEQP